MSVLYNIGLLILCTIGLAICFCNWYCAYESLRTKENHSQIGFFGGIMIYWSLSRLLPERWQYVAYAAFILDVSFPLFILGIFLNIKNDIINSPC